MTNQEFEKKFNALPIMPDPATELTSGMFRTERGVEEWKDGLRICGVGTQYLSLIGQAPKENHQAMTDELPVIVRHLILRFFGNDF